MSIANDARRWRTLRDAISRRDEAFLADIEKFGDVHFDAGGPTAAQLDGMMDAMWCSRRCTSECLANVHGGKCTRRGVEGVDEAVTTLQAMDYTYHGGQFWKPPLGKRDAPVVWVPVTQGLLHAQHPWLYEPMWIALKDGGVTSGHYEWQQGRYPDQFVTEKGQMWAFNATHVMPLKKPAAPVAQVAGATS